MGNAQTFSGTLLVALGGGAGAAARYTLGQQLPRVIGQERVAAFPWATLTANALGCFAMGLLAAWLVRGGDGTDGMRLLLGIGLLGGFTTFSAFGIETVTLIERGQSGVAAAYVLASLVLGLVGVALGLAMIRSAA